MRRQQREHEGVDEGNHQQEFETSMPVPEPGRLHGEFTLGKVESHLNLPAAHVDEDDVPGVVDGGKRLIGEQVKRCAALAGTRNGESERRGGMVRDVRTKENTPGLVVPGVCSVPTAYGSCLARHEVRVSTDPHAAKELSGRPDLNRGPHRPERCALAKLRYAPIARKCTPHVYT